MRAVIFANGNLTDPVSTVAALRPDDLILAADGGARHCLALGVLPAALIGDFDSLDAAEQAAVEQSGAALIAYPRTKDQTDLELALHYAASQGCREVVIFGAVGGRWDHSLANLLLAAGEAFARLEIRLVDGRQEAQVLRGGRAIELAGQPGDTVSLVPLKGDAVGVTTTGLAYGLKDGRLSYGAARGVSNELVATTAQVQLAEGLLICILIHADLPGVGAS